MLQFAMSNLHRYFLIKTKRRNLHYIFQNSLGGGKQESKNLVGGVNFLFSIFPLRLILSPLLCVSMT
jgi:hypothetical protein